MSHSGIFMRPPGKAIVFVWRALFQERPSSSSIATVKEQPASVQWSRLPLHSERQASTNTGALVLKEGGFHIFLGHDNLFDHQNEDHLGDLGNGGLCGGGGVGAGRGMWGSPAGKKCENWTNLGKVSSTSITDGFRKKVFDTLP